MNLFNNKFLRAIRTTALMVLASFLLVSCGGGGGGGGNNDAASPNNTIVTGTVSPPSGVAPTSLTIVSLGETAPVSTSGNFSATVYKDGVAVVAAVLDGKEFSLMNVAVTATNALPAGVMGGNQVKVMAAASPSANNTVTINAHTTAVSMVFVTPYFLTNDPVKAAELISIIDADLKVAELATVIESVFNEADPLSNPALQQALLTAVESVLTTITAQIPAAANVVTSTSSTLYLPKGNVQAAALATTAASIYYADQDYITVIVNPSMPSVYDLSIANKNGGGVDWFAEVMQLNPSQFNSLNDIQSKASDYTALYADERITWLGELYAPAKSSFRYFDLISSAIKWLSGSILGEAIKDKITIPSDVDGIYLVRAYSGGWSPINLGEKLIVRTLITHGSEMDTKSLIFNVTATAMDMASIIIPLDSSTINGKLLVGYKIAKSKVYLLFNTQNPQLSDVLTFVFEVSNAILAEEISGQIKAVTKTPPKMLLRINQTLIKGVKALDPLKKIGSTGKVVERSFELLNLATPLESIVVVVGNPLPPAIPTSLKTMASTSSQVDISWSGVYGAAGYKIYRGGTLIASPTTLVYSDTGLTPSTQYCYTVSAFDAADKESAQSSPQCATTLPVSPPPSTYTLDVSTIGFGSVAPSLPGPPRACNVPWASCVGFFYGSGTTVTLTPVPATGSIFAGWSGGGCSGTGSCIVTMNTNVSVTAIFSTESMIGCNTCIVGTGPVTGGYNHTIVNASMIPCSICHTGSAPPQPVLINTTSLPSATIGVGYSQNVAATGGQTPYTWSVTSGLPAGLSINSATGDIYGNPSTTGGYNFTVTATDSSNPPKTASQALSLVVTSASTVDNIPPVVNAFSASPLSLTVGNAITFNYTVSDSGGSGLREVQVWSTPDVGGMPNPSAWHVVKITPLSGNGPISGAFSAPQIVAGTYWYGLHGVDNAANIGYEPSGIKVVVNPAVVTPPSFVETEPNNSSPTANVLPLRQPYTGKISTSTDADWWVVQVNSGQLLTFILNSPSSANYNLEVYGSTSTNPTLHLICMNNSGNGVCDGVRTGAGGTEFVSFITSVSGAFYARVVGFSGASSTSESYTLQRTD